MTIVLPMACLRWVFLVLAFTCSSPPSCCAEIRKELRTKNQDSLKTVTELDYSDQSNRVNPSRVVQLSWRPRAFLYEGFLTDEECDQLISLANRKNGSFREFTVESRNAAIKRKLKSSELSADIDDVLTAGIEDKISAWTFLPRQISKPLRVEHYELEDSGQRYVYFDHNSLRSDYDAVMATVIVYLSNVTQGGQLFFPKAELEDSHSMSKMSSDCTTTRNPALEPIKGNAVVFFTRNLDGSPDESSFHSRCPVLSGEMWCAVKFFNIRPIQGQDAPVEPDDSDCTDEDESCSAWAALGECQKNALYMIGSPDYYGTCRKSCNAC